MNTPPRFMLTEVPSELSHCMCDVRIMDVHAVKLVRVTPAILTQDSLLVSVKAGKSGSELYAR